MVSMLSPALAKVIGHIVSISTKITQEKLLSSLKRPGFVESVILLAAKELVVINFAVMHTNVNIELLLLLLLLYS